MLPMTDEEADQHALAIYAMMARDIEDALDEVYACDNIRCLETLYAILTTRGGPNTDDELNAIMAGPTKRRLETLKGAPDAAGT